MKVGFIGLGIMGKPMAKNLVRHGYEVWVNSRSADAVKVLTDFGAKYASRDELAESCEVIMTMLPDGPQVKEVMIENGGVAAHMRAGQTFIDMSSINPATSKEIAEVLYKNGIEMLDAPVSGGEPKAVDGTLSFMVGGRKETFDKYRELLSAMGSSVVWCGEIGAGNTVKLANQVIVASNIAAVAEAFMLAKRAGVEPSVVLEAIKGGLAGSTVLNAKGPMMIENNTEPGFRINLHIKDLNNALGAGQLYGSPLPLTSSVMEMMQYLKANGMGDCDHSALAKYYEQLAGDTIC